MKIIKNWNTFLENKNIGRVVFTGTPGSGKSTSLDELEKMGYLVVEESARKFIKYYKENDESKLPWNNREEFQKVVEQDQINNWRINNNCFFDRSIVDELAYRRCYKQEISNSLINNCKTMRYDKVFMFEPWEEIYEQDSERTETYQEAKALFDHLMKAYKDCGYNPIIVPKKSVDYRTEFILDRI